MPSWPVQLELLLGVVLSRGEICALRQDTDRRGVPFASDSEKEVLGPNLREID